jgi:NAD+ kinase
MKIAFYGKSFGEDAVAYVQQLFSKLEMLEIKLFIYKPFFEFLKNHNIVLLSEISLFSKAEELKKPIDFIFSVGGDGTILEVVTLIKNAGIPILGLNTGRLGFLSSISKENCLDAIDNLIKKKYTIDQRSLIRLETDKNLFGNLNFALNEITVQKKESATMIMIKAYVNDDYLNSYWADGLIVSTPTGSTGYSLSCGGPIIAPDSENFVITPIATHNLTVRPIVIPDNNVITLNVEGRNMSFLTCLDSRSQTIDAGVTLTIRKESFKIKLVKLENENFFNTIRNKLMWGADKRN